MIVEIDDNFRFKTMCPEKERIGEIQRTIGPVDDIFEADDEKVGQFDRVPVPAPRIRDQDPVEVKVETEIRKEDGRAGHVVG